MITNLRMEDEAPITDAPEEGAEETEEEAPTSE